MHFAQRRTLGQLKLITLSSISKHSNLTEDIRWLDLQGTVQQRWAYNLNR